MYKPFPHQVTDSDALLQYQHGLLWADPGTGKTVTAMETFRKGGYDKAVFIVPPIALTMWRTELMEHLPEPTWPLVVYGRVMRKHYPMARKFMIMSYGMVKKYQHLIQDFTYSTKGTTLLVLDESHYLKTPDAQRTRYVFGDFCSYKGGAAMFFDSVLQLTGTPILNHSNDLWSQLRGARPEILEHYGVLQYQQFVNEFCVQKLKAYGPSKPRWVVTGSRNQDTLRALIRDCRVVERTLTEVYDTMPKLHHLKYDIEYKGVRQTGKEYAEIAKELNDPDSAMSKQRRLLGVAKAEGVVSRLKERDTFPALVGFWHHDAADAIEAAAAIQLPNKVIERIDGSVKSSVRDQIIADFNDGKIDILLGQMAAMGVAINLQKACSYIAIAEEVPSPGVLDQFIARVYRAGQKEEVDVEELITAHEIDRTVLWLRTSKQLNIDKLKGASNE